MLNNDMDMTTVTSVEQAAMLAPSSEVRPKRRTFTAAQKLAILREADACPEGTIGEVLRRHGIYSSHLSKWRQLRSAGKLVAGKRGPKVDEQAQRLGPAAGGAGGRLGGWWASPAAACMRHASHIRRYLSGRRPARPTPSAQPSKRPS